MKEIKLKESNNKRYCINCKATVELVIKGRDGYCPFCEEQLYSVDTRGAKK